MNNSKRNNKKTILIVCIVLAVLISAFAIVYSQFFAKPVQGAKTISVIIVHADELENTQSIQTDAEFLRDALEENDLIVGTESDFGLYVLTVDGATVDEANQEWWSFTQGGEMLNTGVDDTPIEDGDQFEITFTVGW